MDLKITDGAHDNMVMIVSKSTVSVKKSDNQIFAWVVDQSTGEVIKDMNLKLFQQNGSEITNGKTNNDGVWMTDLKSSLEESEQLIIGQSDNDYFITSTYWDGGIQSYDFGLRNGYEENVRGDDYRLYLTLDRPIYRPGHKVYYKGIIRQDNDGSYKPLPLGESINIKIKAPKDKLVYEKDLNINSYGSFSNEFVLSEDASLGRYSVIATYKENTYTQKFQVEEYRAPDLSIDINANSNYVNGDEAKINVNASYYFGAPVSNRNVKWGIMRRDYNFTWDKDYRYEFSDNEQYYGYYGGGYYSGESVSEGKQLTDSNGDTQISLPLDISKHKSSQRMVVEAAIKDESNVSVAGSNEFIVHQGEYYVGVKPQFYSNKTGENVNFDVVSVNHNEIEIPNISFKANFYKRIWKSVREKNPDDGKFYYTTKHDDQLVSSGNFETNAQGYSTISFIPEEGGLYRVRISSQDDKQNLIQASTYVWVSGYNFNAPRENHDRINIVTDKKDYMVGDEASVFIASPFSAPAKTLITLEREKILDYQVVDLDNNLGNQNNFPINIDSEYVPNAFISATLIKNGTGIKNPTEFKMGYTEINVTNPKNKLDITVVPDKENYKPREKAKLRVYAKDGEGNPQKTEIVLSIVDKAIWDLSNVEFPNIYDFYYQPKNLGVKTSTLLTKSIDRVNANTNLGAKGGSGGGGGDGDFFETSRNDFKQNVYYNAHLETNDNGYAEVEIDLPDNLTTWQADVIANTKDSAFGEAKNSFVVSQDLLIRPFVPRFLSVNDESKLGAIIVNTSGKDIEANASISANGLEILDSSSQNINIPDGEQIKVIWNTKVEVDTLNHSDRRSAITTIGCKRNKHKSKR